MNHDVLLDWTASEGKPWTVPEQLRRNRSETSDPSAPPIAVCKVSDDWHHPLPGGRDPAGPNDPGDGDQEALPILVDPPSFIQDLLQVADRNGIFSDADGTDVLRVRTWYVHHAQLQRQTIFRILELHEGWRSWEADLVSSWRDFIMPNQILEYHLVRPDPYRGYLTHMVHADLILSQGDWMPRGPGLITVHYQGHRAPPLNYAVAASLPQRVSGVDLVVVADGMQWCNSPTHRCRINFGWDTIPFTTVPTHRMFAAHSFVCHVFHREDSIHEVAIDDVDALASSSTARGSQELPDEGTFSIDNLFVVAASSGDLPMDPTSGSPTSGWRSAIWSLLQQHGHTDADDEGIIVFVNSYFIDHEHHLHEDRSRPLRFDLAHEEWESHVRFIWEDVVDEHLPLEITIVNPDPPFAVRRGTIATVIVHQRLSPLRAACLTTAVIPADPVLRIVESAHSFEIGLLFQDLLRHAGVADICHLRQVQGFGGCTLHIAWRLVPIDTAIPVYHDLGLTIRVPIPLQDIEVDQAVDDVQVSPSVAGHDHELEEVNSLMARRPIPRRRPSSSTSYTTSSSSSAPDWRQTVIFLLDGRSVSSSLHWHDSDAMLEHAALAVDLPMSQVLRVQHITHRPTDFIQIDLQGLLLQRSNEFRPSPFVRIVLLDLELHFATDVQPSPFQRRARWLPYVTTRKALFRVLELAAVHQEHPALCHLWQNNVLIENRDDVPLRLADGDYVKVFVCELETQDDCISSGDEIVNITSHSVTNSSGDQSGSDLDDTHLFQVQLEPIVSIGDPPEASSLQTSTILHPQTLRVQASDVRAPPLQDSGSTEQPPAPLRGHLRFHPDDLERFRRLFEARSFVECEEEGPVAYVDTWFIHHQHHPECLESRAIKLHHDSPNWLENLVEPWLAELDPNIDAIVHLVQPQPPCTMTECVLAHLIIEQSHRPQYGIGLLSKSGYDRAHRGSNVIAHRAFSLPAVMNAALILRFIDLYDICLHQFCRIRRGQLPFNMFEWEELPRACCLTVYYDRVRAVETEAEPDHLELLQRRSARMNEPQVGIDLQPSKGDCENFEFNPNAQPFIPNFPTVPQPPARWSDLYWHWNRVAFSWQGEPRSAIFTTWFVDQHNPALRRCDQSRQVSLSEDYRSWDAALRQVWPDRALVGAPILIHVVAPQPPTSHRDAAVHVLLVQNPQDGLSTTLVTGYDEGQSQDAHSFQLAFTTNEQFLLDQLILGLGLTSRCFPSGRPMQCSAWYEQVPLVLGWPVWLADGSGIVFRFGAPQQAPVVAEDMSLLQTRLQMISPKIELPMATLAFPSSSQGTTCERLTTGSVAHDQWPLVDMPAVGDTDAPPEWELLDAISLIAGVDDMLLPSYVECPQPWTEVLVAQELRLWGHSCDVYRFEAHDVAVCFPLSWRETTHLHHYMFCHSDTSDANWGFFAFQFSHND